MSRGAAFRGRAVNRRSGDSGSRPPVVSEPAEGYDGSRKEVPMDLFQGCSGRRLANGLEWLREPQEWGFGEEGLRIVPAARTDFFRPWVGEGVDNACLLYATVSGDFTAIAEARATLTGFGDAAALTVRASPELWAKICIERSPIGDVSIVSVVTDGASDDANNELLPRPSGLLRITRKGDLFGMHFAAGAGRWRFVRTFGLRMPREIMVGVHAQAPFGGGGEARFSRFELSPGAVSDFRSGE
jgi:regulation of enolase protein 1 (concanavalin A-like superfamily)